jgi:hypothetical protein
MKNILFLFLTMVIASACNSSDQKSHENETADDTSLVNASLSPEQTEKIKTIHAVFQEVYPIGIKEFMDNFKRDPDIETEIGVWMNMLNAYQEYLAGKTPVPDLETKKEIFALILNRSMVPAERAYRNVNPKILSETEAHAVMNCYTAEPVKLDTVQ